MIDPNTVEQEELRQQLLREQDASAVDAAGP